MKGFIKLIRFTFFLSKSILPLVFIKSLASASLPFVSLYFMGDILDSLLSGSSFEAIIPSIVLLASIDLALALIVLVTNHFYGIQRNLLEYKLDLELVNKSFSLPYELFEKKETRDMLEKAVDGANGSGGIPSFVEDVLGGLLSAITSLVYSLVLLSACFVSIESDISEPLFLFLNSPFSALTIFGAVGLMLLATYLIGQWANKASRRFFEENVESNRQFGYMLDYSSDSALAKDIRVYGLDGPLDDLYQEYSERDVKQYNRTSITFAGIQIGYFIPVALVLTYSYFYIGAKAYYGIVSVGSIITLVGAISSFASALSKGISVINRSRLMSYYLGYFFDFLSLPDDNLSGDPLPEGEPVIAFEHVSFKYPGVDDYALNDLSFTITPHKKTAIVGPNGAGKSTIIKLVSRFYTPTSGKITLNGVDIQTLDKKAYNALLAILFQDFTLFPISVGDNVACSSEYSKEKVLSCLDLAGFDAASPQKCPEGLDTIVLAKSDEGKDYSGGERQKIAIARALYKDSPFILLDEPTSALDPKSELEVYDSIASLVEEKTSLFISHRMSSTKFCDDIIVLDKGKLVQRGSHRELSQQEGLYKKMFDEQAKYYK